MPIYWGRSLTRLEAAVSVALVASLIAIFLDRAFAYMELAERTAMEVTVQQVNSALQIRRGAELLEGAAMEPAKAVQRNPFELARLAVGNLHPDVADAKAFADLERGYWVFDRSGRELIYLPQLHRRLHTPGDEAFVRFHLVRAKDSGYVLVAATQYSWD